MCNFAIQFQRKGRLLAFIWLVAYARQRSFDSGCPSNTGLRYTRRPDLDNASVGKSDA